MRYTVIFKKQCFYTDYFDYENLYVEGMIVIDNTNDLVTFDGKNWEKIEEDNL